MIERIMRAIAKKHPMSEEQTRAVREEVTQFANELLEKYKNRLSSDFR